MFQSYAVFHQYRLPADVIINVERCTDIIVGSRVEPALQLDQLLYDMYVCLSFRIRQLISFDGSSDYEIA